MEESDGAVIAASLETPGAFGVIFDRHGSTLLRFLARRVDPAEAEDLLGEVFRIAFERRSAFEQDRDSARPWLSAITGPEGVVVHRRTPSIYPRLAYRDEVAALDFLTRAFGLVERRESRMEQPGGMLAWLEIGDGVVMIGRAGEERHGLFSPLDAGAPTAAVNVYVHDVDAHYHRAESEGAQIVTPLEDMFWGDRRYEALDLEGHRWHFAERLSEIRA